MVVPAKGQLMLPLRLARNAWSTVSTRVQKSTIQQRGYFEARSARLAVSVRDQKTASGGTESDKTVHNDSTQMEEESPDSVSFSDEVSFDTRVA
jgi:hypothetical protein